MMVTPSGAVFLVGGIICSLLPPSCPPWLVAFLCTCLTLIYALSSWKPRSWRIACRWWIVGPGGCFAVGIMLFGGCFAAGGYFEFGGCFVAIPLLWQMLCRRGRDIRWMFHHRFLLRACSLGIFGDNILCRSCSGGLCLGGLLGESSPFVLLLLTTCCVNGYDRLCVCLYFFFSIFLSLALCILVLVKSCLAAASLCL